MDEDGNPVESTTAPKVNWVIFKQSSTVLSTSMLNVFLLHFKNSEKKLVRYYDSKVVSTKGNLRIHFVC